jgi:hypothetical protein
MSWFKSPNNVIPEITHPLGRYWDQPNREDIDVWANQARMSQKAFDNLVEYSLSLPTGVYRGKMWKKRVYLLTGERWYLCWYGDHADKKLVSTNYRKIVIV